MNVTHVGGVHDHQTIKPWQKHNAVFSEPHNLFTSGLASVHETASTIESNAAIKPIVSIRVQLIEEPRHWETPLCPTRQNTTPTNCSAWESDKRIAMADLTNRRTVSKCTLDMKTLHTENLKTHKKRACSTSMHCFVILQTEIENKLWFIHQNNGHDDRHCKTIRRKTSAKPKLKNKTDSMGFKHTPCIIIRNNPSHRTILWMRTGWQRNSKFTLRSPW